MKEQRPKLKIPLTQQDLFVEVLSGALVLFLWIYVTYKYTTLPDQIPHHFNIAGEADSYGHKSILWILPGIATFIYIVFSLISRVPDKFNYTTVITPQNAWIEYSNTLMFLRWIKLFVMTLFSYLTYKVVSGENSIGRWFVPALLLCITLISVRAFYPLFKKKK